MSLSLRSILILSSFFALLHLLQLCSGKQPFEESVNDAKYLTGIAQVAVLPKHFRPDKKITHGGRRLIFIGDVHGAYNELVSLLEKVKYHSSNGTSPTTTVT
jgi:hypothetical protein